MSFRSGALIAAAAMFASRAAAQSCITTTRTAPPSDTNAVIRVVAVKTDAPITPPLLGAWVSSLRRRTENSVVQRQLLFEPGQRLDSARVAETLRRLRDQRLYSDIVLVVNRCAGGDTVDLTVTTQDAWTLRPVARITPPSTVSLGVEDRNFLGTARTFSVTNDQTTNGHGGSFTAVDPWVLGQNVTGSFRFSDVAGVHMLRAALRNHELSVFDPWQFETGVGRQTFRTTTATERPVSSVFQVAHIGHSLYATSDAVIDAYAGASRDQGDVIEIRGGDNDIPTEHYRDFQAVDVGAMRRTAKFDTVSWFAHRGFLDIPTGLQGDVLGAYGRDQAQNANALHYDAWVGQMWIPTRGALFDFDASATGFLGDVRGNRIDRASVIGFAEAPNGFWDGRLLLEQLLDLDPDLRTLSIANVGSDPSFAAVPGPMRLADRTVASSVERSIHLRPFARESMLDGAFFAAGSVRWDAPASTVQTFAVGVVGARLRLFSANGSFSSTRIDLGFPVIANHSVVHRPLLSVSLTSLLDAPRSRDGRRRQQ